MRAAFNKFLFPLQRSLQNPAKHLRLNVLQLLTIFSKRSFLGISKGSESVYLIRNRKLLLHEKYEYGIFRGPYFPEFELNMETYKCNFRILSKYEKKRTKKASVFGHFSQSVCIRTYATLPLFEHL